MGDFKLVVVESGTPFDRTQYVKEEGNFGFSCTRGQRGTATIPLIIPPWVSYAPLIGFPVFIYEVNTSTSAQHCVFAGTVDQIEIDWIADFGYHLITLSAVSLEQQLDVVQAPEIEFDSTNAGTIVTALLSAAGTLPVPIVAGTISSGASISKRNYDGKTSIWAAITQLATDSGFIAYVDPEDQKLYFTSKSARATGFTLTGAMILWESLKWSQSRADFTDTMVLQMDPNSLPPGQATFTGDGVTTSFTLPAPATEVTAAFLTIATQATVLGTFTGLPADGDTITITLPGSDPTTYTFQSTLSNTTFGVVLTGGTVSQTIANLVDAINNAISTAGIRYSSPTWTNQAVTASQFSSTQIKLTAKPIGTIGNGIMVAESSGSFSWAASTLTGALDNRSQQLSVGPTNGGNYDLMWTPGSTTIQLQVAPANNITLSVDYYSDMSGFVSVNAGVAGSLGVQAQYSIMRSRAVSLGPDAVQQAAAVLAEYAKLPAKVSFSTYTPGFYCGRWQTVAIGSNPVGAAALLDGSWVIQSLSASWTAGFGGLTEPFGHFKYNITLINTAQIATYQDMLAQMLDTGPFKSTAPGGGTQQTPPPVVPTAAAQTFQRTFLVKDSTVRSSAGDVCFLWTRDISLSPISRAIAQAQRIVGVPRLVLTSDLTVRFNVYSNASPPALVQQYIATIPAGTQIRRPVTTAVSGTIVDGYTIEPDILASDGQKDALGVASFTFFWE